MKIVLASLLLSLPALAAFAPEGEYIRKHQIGFMGYPSKEACEEDQGKWDDGVCVLDAEDSVAITRDGNIFTATVSTVTTNAHTCDFTGKGDFSSATVLTVSAPSEIYVPGENGGEGKFIPGVCELQVEYGQDNATVSVSQKSGAETCSSFCGMNAHLDIETAKRK